jgi:outer membrane protein insertion porin family
MIQKNIGHCFRLAILASSLLSWKAASAAERINNITIDGNHRIEKETIESYLNLNVGDEFTIEKQNEAIRSLYSTSMFENIQISCTDGRLLVLVQETPFVSKVVFKGNNKVKTAVFLKEITTHAGDSLSKSKIQADIDKILEIYKRSGRFSVTVEPQIETKENSRVKVIFNITEGPKTAVRNIYFAGNESYRNTELKTVIMSKETAWYKFLDSNDTYDPDRMEYDKELLKEFYHSVGFADAQVISATAELSPTKEYFTLIYSIEEGEKYNIGTIDIDNKIADLDTGLVKKLISVKAGNLFNMTQLEKIADKISEELSNKAYQQVKASPELKKNRDSRTVDVTFLIEKADKTFINKINITGNPKTAEKVIRREFRIHEGDIFNRTRIEKSERALRNLDYFEKVSIKMNPTKNAGRYDLNVDVEEKSTASVGMSLGYNSAEGPFGELSLIERNLVGTGKILNAAIHKSRKSITYSAGLTDPHFLDKDLSVGASLFNSKSGNSGSGGFGDAAQPYSLDTIGSRLSIGYEITDDLYHNLGYTIKRDKLTVDKVTASTFIAEQAGKFTTSAIDHTLTYDRTDSRIVPKNGYIVSASHQYAGVGGDNNYLKNELDGKVFKSFFNNKLTIKLAGEVGMINGTNGHTVRISDRFKVGDSNLRGFASGGIGPRDKRTKEGIGGQKYYTFTTELNFPVGLPEEMNFTGAAFVDVGALWGFDVRKNSLYSKADIYDSTDPRVGAGVGFVWVTKLMPIKVYWALPIRKKKYDETQHWHIGMATHF